ncbi:MAG: glycosyltransferase family 39 protein, partial [Phycisphaerae bacterium]|nr:glycosyltransferase family 39 protein [Phycisphaerae bacterium]
MPLARTSRIHPLSLFVVALLLLAMLLGAHHLGHTRLNGLDESFHALVARNLLKHPLTPTLIDQPFLPTDESDWMNSHLWLHKPPLALWTIAASLKIFGISALALRLPSLLFSTGSAWLTYRIGVRLGERWAGAIAAALQAFNPAILMLVHGYVFSDHVDIALIFWTELGVL